MPAFSFAHDHILGTSLEVRVQASEPARADEADRLVVAELARLESVFSVFDPTSELCRWRHGEAVELSGEFCQVMESALRWMERTNGKFNPLVGGLMQIWERAPASGRVPFEAELAEAAGLISRVPFVMSGGRPVATGDCANLNLNALAKGAIVDLAAQVGARLDLDSLCVNAGGDLLHIGSGHIRVGIENPHRPYDNEPPLRVIEIANAAVATSGSARRGFRVGDTWYGHVLDPRTGWPASQVSSVTVVAPDAQTADVLATSVGVGSAVSALTDLEDAEGVEGFVVDVDSNLLATSGWASLEVPG